MKITRLAQTFLSLATFLTVGDTALAQHDLHAEAWAIHEGIFVLDARTGVLLDTTPERVAAGTTSRADLDKSRRGCS